jgi:hypothetical protein
MTACTQPGCIGTIVDDYCYVCGSPAGASPFIPAGAAASAANCTQPGCIGTIVDDYCYVCGSPAGAPPFLPAGAAARQPNLAEEERPTKPIPRVQIAIQPSSTQDTAVPAAADPVAPGIENVAEEKVDPAAARQELSGALGLSPSIGDMELMMTSGTGKLDAEKGDPVAADTEKTDAAPPGPDDPDTVEVEMPPVGAVLRDGRQPRPQLPEEEVHGPVPVQNPADKKRFGFLLAAALAALLIGALFFANKDVDGVTAKSDATVTATATMPVSKSPSVPADESTDTGRGGSTIQLEDLSASARPFEAVRIQGTYRGGAGTFLRVQRWEGGKWLDFPLPTKIDQSGRFITQAEFGQPGRYWLRVLDPDSGVASKPFVVVIKG